MKGSSPKPLCDGIPEEVSSFKVVRPLGSGSFGQVMEAIDTRTGVRVAMKFEDKDAAFPQLLYEARIMEQLAHCRGIPELYWFKSFRDWNVLVMPLLGKSLEDDRQERGGVMPVEHVMQIARQGLDRLRMLHEMGWVYRDIKPENFLWHHCHGKQTLFIIDFGLCKRVIYPGTSEHIKNQTGKGLTGTPRYASIHAHTGQEVTRRDDLASFMYMLIYLVRGGLPWQELPKPVSKENNYAKIAACKRSYRASVLCEGLPPCFLNTFRYARSLKFEDCPDYAYLESLWR